MLQAGTKVAALFDCVMLDLDAFTDTELTPEQLLEIVCSKLTVGGTALVRGRSLFAVGLLTTAYSNAYMRICPYR